MQKLAAFWQLMRADRPIGTYLLAWPTIWALMIAGSGNPPMRIVVIFLLGTFVMRSAGCVINDFADRNFDGHVRRTRQRPIPAGKISATDPMIGFIALLAIAFGLVMQLNTQTVMLSFFAAGVAALYPFCKRWTHLPQVVLGIAFSFGILMAFTALESEQWLIAGLLFLTNVGVAGLGALFIIRRNMGLAGFSHGIASVRIPTLADTAQRARKMLPGFSA